MTAMDADDWTPRRGWAIALKRTGLRIGVYFILQLVSLHFAWPIAQRLPQHPVFIMLVVCISGALGLPAGLLIPSKLAERSGLAGSSLILPVMGMLVVSSAIAYQIISHLYGGGGLLIGVLAAGFAIWAGVLTLRSLLLQ